MSEFEMNTPARPRNLKWVGLVLVLVAAGVVANGVYSRLHAQHALTTWTDAMAIPTVATISPKPLGATSTLTLPGRLDAYVDAPIYARVPGYLHAWYADIGTHVKAGQVLGLIDTPDLDQQLQQAQANLQNAIANEKLAATTAARWSKMLSQDSVSQQEADEKTSDLTAKQAMVAAARADVGRLQALESFKRVTAPFDGVVTARRTDVGDLINAGSGGTGDELFTVSDANHLRVYVNVPQNEDANIKPGMTAKLQVPERPGMTFDAKVVNTDDSITPSSGTLLVQLSVDNASGLLIPGEFTNVTFAVPNTGQGTIVPASALIFRSQGLQIAVAGNDGKAHLRHAKILTDYGQTVELTAGLQPGEKVINNPPDSLADGDAIKLYQDPSEAHAQDAAEHAHG